MLAECSKTNEILPKRSEAYDIFTERSEAYNILDIGQHNNDVAERSEANVAEAERSEAYHILDIGRYNLKRVCSSAKSLEPALRAPNLCDHRRSRWPRKLGLLRQEYTQTMPV